MHVDMKTSFQRAVLNLKRGMHLLTDVSEDGHDQGTVE